MHILVCNLPFVPEHRYVKLSKTKCGIIVVEEAALNYLTL